MSRGAEYDAIVVGSGPNGLAAAITVARAGWKVLVVEAADRPGGGLRSSALTLPGFLHDDCASVLPLAAASPLFSELHLERYGLAWAVPSVPLAHPFDDDEAVLLERSLDATAGGLGSDSERYRSLVGQLVQSQPAIVHDLLGPLKFPSRPLAAVRFGLPAMLPASALARLLFRSLRSRALLAGLAAHSLLPLERPATAAFGLVLAMLAHSTGWPLVRGGSAALARSLTACLEDLGGEVRTGSPVTSLADLPSASLLFFDVTPRQLLRIAGERFDRAYRRRLERYRYGPGVCKVDYALSAPIPWRDPRCRRAGTVHLGGRLEEIAAGERYPWRGQIPDKPFVLLAQPSLFDSTRAPAGQHTAWAYCHVPHDSNVDASAVIEAQIERFAPGFGERVLARHVRTARDLEAYNPNLVGGDINGGVQDWRQLFTRPIASFKPYATSDPSIFICSSSTPPGGGVHGLCGYHAARAALRRH